MPGKPKMRHPVTQPLDPSYRLIALTRNQNAIVDAEDFDWLSQWNWTAHWCKSVNKFYAKRKGAGWMHRQILGFPKGKMIDHKNGDPLDNRKGNLRVCTREQNGQNAKHQKRTEFKGINKQRNKWVARIVVNKQLLYLGCFTSAREAAEVYDRAARKYFGEFAHPNFKS